MTNSADPDQLAASDANWSGSTLFAKTGHDVISKRRVKTGACLTLILLNNLISHTHFLLSANQITLYNVFVQIHKLNDKQCISWSDGFFLSDLKNWPLYTDDHFRWLLRRLTDIFCIGIHTISFPKTALSVNPDQALGTMLHYTVSVQELHYLQWHWNVAGVGTLNKKLTILGGTHNLQFHDEIKFPLNIPKYWFS